MSEMFLIFVCLGYRVDLRSCPRHEDVLVSVPGGWYERMDRASCTASCYGIGVELSSIETALPRSIGQTLQGSFSAVSKRMFARKYAFEKLSPRSKQSTPLQMMSSL